MTADKKTLLRDAAKYVQKGQVDKAIEAYKAVVKDDPKDVKVHNALGDLYIRQGRKKDGIAEYLEVANLYEKDGFALRSVAICQKILNLDADLITVRLKLADLYAGQKLPAEARAQYLQVAGHHEKKGEVSAALDIFCKIANLDPQNLSVRAKLGGMFEKQKFPEKAAEEYVRAAKGYREKKETDQAGQFYARAFKLHPANLDARRGLAELHGQRRDWQVVVGLLHPLAAKGSRESDLLLLYGEALLQVDHPREAAVALHKLQEREPNSVPVNLLLGRALIKSGDTEKGIAAFNRCVNAHLAESKFEGAEALLREMAGDAPDDDKIQQRILEIAQKRGDQGGIAHAYHRLAQIYEKKGLLRNAAGALEKYLELQPGDTAAARRLADLQGQAPAPKAAPPPPSAPPIPHPEAPEEEKEEKEEEAEIDLEKDLSALGLAPGEEEELLIEIEGEEQVPSLVEEPTTLEEIKAYLGRGLFEKAAGFLEEYLKGNPDELEAYGLLCETHRRQGDRKGQRDAMVRLAELHRRRGRLDEASLAYQEVLGIDPKYGAAARALGEIAIEEERRARPITPPAPEEISLDLLEEPIAIPAEEISLVPAVAGPIVATEPMALPESAALPEQTIAPEPAALPEAAIAPGPAAPPEPEALPESKPAAESMPAPETLVEPEIVPPAEPVPTVETVPPVVEETAIPEEAAPQFWGFEEIMEVPEPVPAVSPEIEEISLEGFGEELETLGVEEAPPPAAEKIAIPETGTGTGELEEFLAEANFYFQQGLLDEAEFLYHKLIKLAPGHPEIAEQIRRLEQVRGASRGAEPEPSPALEAAPAGDELSALDRDLDLAFAGSGAQPPAEAPEPEPSAALPGGDFSDFLSDLRQEIETQIAPPPSALSEEEGLTEIFQEFQRSVKEQLGEEDFETHYNLGIAYKEMGLMEEALGEFSLAERSPVRRLDAVSMIALCLREMGRSEEAVEKLLQGVSLALEGSEERKGFLYDLAVLYQQSGREAEAQEIFSQLVFIDPAYRDVASHVRVAPAAPVPEARPAAGTPQKKPKVSYL